MSKALPFISAISVIFISVCLFTEWKAISDFEANDLLSSTIELTQ